MQRQEISVFVSLAQDEVDACRRFAKSVAGFTRAIEFNEGDTVSRDKLEILYDTLMGKVGEVGFSRFMWQRFMIHLPVNFDVYESHTIGDDFDFELNGRTIDVKTTKCESRFLMVQPKMAKPESVFVMCRAHNRGRVIEVVGWAGYQALNLAGVIPKGSVIPGTKTVLQADNHVIIDDELDRDFSRIA